MKIKIFKKLLAALCAATMSMSAISSVGAVRYQNINSDFQLKLQGESAAAETNKTIQGMLSDIRNLTYCIDNVTDGFILRDGSVDNFIDKLKSIDNNLSSICEDNLIIPDVTIINALNESLKKISEDIQQNLSIRTPVISYSSACRIDEELKEGIKLTNKTINLFNQKNMNNTNSNFNFMNNNQNFMGMMNNNQNFMGMMNNNMGMMNSINNFNNNMGMMNSINNFNNNMGMMNNNQNFMGMMNNNMGMMNNNMGMMNNNMGMMNNNQNFMGMNYNFNNNNNNNINYNNNNNNNFMNNNFNMMNNNNMKMVFNNDSNIRKDDCGAVDIKSIKLNDNDNLLVENLRKNFGWSDKLAYNYVLLSKALYFQFSGIRSDLCLDDYNSLSKRSKFLLEHANNEDLQELLTHFKPINGFGINDGEKHNLQYFLCCSKMNTPDVSSHLFLEDVARVNDIDQVVENAKSHLPKADFNSLKQKYELRPNGINPGQQNGPHCWLFSSQTAINFYLNKQGKQTYVNQYNGPKVIEQLYESKGSSLSILNKYGGADYLDMVDYIRKFDINPFYVSFSATNEDGFYNSDKAQTWAVPEMLKALLYTYFANHQDPAPVLAHFPGHWMSILGINPESNQVLILNSATGQTITMDIDTAVNEIAKGNSDMHNATCAISTLIFTSLNKGRFNNCDGPNLKEPTYSRPNENVTPWEGFKNELLNYVKNY